MQTISKNFDVVVVGGGMSGICAAIASARHGAKTALIHNRPVLGGNASSEIRMHICGADVHASRPNARESGILEEILLKNKHRNPNHSFALFDSVLWECCSFEPNLELFLNTHMDKVEAQENKVTTVSASQQTTEKRFNFSASIFIDATGDGTLGAMAGAEFMYGREDKSEFNEPDGVEIADNYTMGSTLMFVARDIGKPVKFVKPFWAYTFDEEHLKHRNHSDISAGYWWIELGGKDLHIIDDAETLRDELVKTVYGVWDHIKNSGNHSAENYELEWVGMLPGKRESRRLKGEYVLRQTDLENSVRFEDAIAYGGWSMDCHVIEGFKTSSEEPTKYIHLKDVYTIPYRCIVSKNIDNLMLAGRAISASHLAFASTRVMGTCAVLGQAAGTAAAESLKQKIQPKEMQNHIKNLQQQLLKDDCYIPSIKNNDHQDLALKSTVTASSFKEEGPPANVINGIARPADGKTNCYVSGGISNSGEFVELSFDQKRDVSKIQIVFDSDFSKEIAISVINHVKNKQHESVPTTLVKDYDVTLFNDENEVYHKQIKDNHQRFNVIDLETSVRCNKIKITAYNTNGCEDVRIFEVRAYEQ